MLRHFVFSIALAAVLAITGCGIKGPLVLPPTASPTAAPPTTVPPNAPAAPTARPAERAQ
jgi:predicted small lipoprotein YifL